MNKALLREFQLQAGGSHYPAINPQMQETFARLIVEACMDAVRGVGHEAVKSIEDRFQYYVYSEPTKSD